MDDEEMKFNEDRANKVRKVLKRTFEELISKLK